MQWTGCCGMVFMMYLRVRMSVRVLRYTGPDRGAIEVIPHAERSAEPGINVAVGESSPDREPLRRPLHSRRPPPPGLRRTPRAGAGPSAPRGPLFAPIRAAEWSSEAGINGTVEESVPVRNPS